ncbi:hypothetical protein ABZX98_19280 [Streptomyces sp. NPDC002992]|uniref:hypothetical protein n=1 Tax=Streptomyces sp. NPDC002992 TaxID=3154273 RepID=UPI0033ADBDC8
MTLPGQFRNAHGDPATWSSQEIEQYLDLCDGVMDIFDALPKAAAFAAANPSATPAEIAAHLRGGAR